MPHYNFFFFLLLFQVLFSILLIQASVVRGPSELQLIHFSPPLYFNCVIISHRYPYTKVPISPKKTSLCIVRTKPLKYPLRKSRNRVNTGPLQI